MASETWVNAVITGQIPLEVHPDASDQEKLEAAVKAAEDLHVYVPDGYEVTHETVSDDDPPEEPRYTLSELTDLFTGEEAVVAAVEAHGGSVVPHEEAMMRDALQAAIASIKGKGRVSPAE